MKSKLLLHTCCGPCVIYVAQKLMDEGYQVTLFFYNPNIFPEEEYNKRLNEIKHWAVKIKLPLIIPEYNHQLWLAQVKGLESEPEGGKRCSVCFSNRLQATAKYAQENSFTHFASTLTSGRNKPAEIINPLGTKIAQQHGLEFITGDWKKHGGQELACQLSKEENFYRQNYCGCEFSIRK